MKLDDKVREIFVESCMEQLKNVEASILDLENAHGEYRQDQITRIFRAAHSIKGDAGSMGLENISRYAHTIENVLQLVREGGLAVSQHVINELLFAFDRLLQCIKASDLGQGQNLHKETLRLDALLASAQGEELQGGAAALQEKGAPEADDDQSGVRVSAESFATEDKITRVTILAEKLDFLVDRIGELSIVQTRLSRLARMEHDSKFLPVAEAVEGLCSQLRDQVLELRMLPLQVSYAKYRRLVRDLCSELGKSAAFVMNGQNTELDKKLIEELNTPLIHLLRNAVDHGIEPPHLREYLGKPVQGRIEVSASQLGGEVLIEVKDDGKGIEGEKLFQLAVKKSLIPADAVLTEQEKLELIFMPGLTTAEKISGVSGRGVGMDAVKASIQLLRGRIGVVSEPGKGTCFRLQLPVSMAIIDCLRVSVGSSEFFMHLDYVEECIELHRDDNEDTIPPRRYALRGEYLPLVCLRHFFQLDGERPQPAHIVVVRTSQGRFGIVADAVLGQHQAVIRHLGPAVGKVEGILGATVTENGTMGLILDMTSLAYNALREEMEHWHNLRHGHEPE